MVKISQTDSLHDCMFELIFSRKSESVSFSHNFCNYFIGCGFVYRSNSWIQLRTNNVSYHFFVFLSPGGCFNPRSIFKTHLKAHSLLRIRTSGEQRCVTNLNESRERTDRLLLAAVELRKKKLFTRKVWGLRSPWSSNLRPPKHRLMLFLSILSAKEAICPY